MFLRIQIQAQITTVMETQIEPRAINGQFRSMRKGENDESIYTFVASTSDADRHRTVINQSKWELDNFRANPIIGYQHNLYGDMCNAPDPDDVVGKSVKTYTENNQLLVDVVFDQENEKAIKIESKVNRGFLSTVSVGFIEKGEGRMGTKDLDEDPELYYFEGQELLEVSIVNIPSNPKAAKKSLRSQTFDALRYIYRELGGKYRFSEIEDMKIGDVIDMMDGKEKSNVKFIIKGADLVGVIDKKADTGSGVKKEPLITRRYKYKGKVIKEIEI